MCAVNVILILSALNINWMWPCYSKHSTDPLPECVFGSLRGVAYLPTMEGVIECDPVASH